MDLPQHHLNRGAVLAPDGIPLHYGDPLREFQAASDALVLMDRSHEGRLVCDGRDRLDLLQRISTNDVASLRPGSGCATILTTATGRIIDRLLVYHNGDSAIVTTEPGRGTAVVVYVRRQVFYKDDFRVQDLSLDTRLFALHGPQADELVGRIAGGISEDESMALHTVTIGEQPVVLLRRKSLSGGHWAVLAPAAGADLVWEDLRARGHSLGLVEAGSVVYNAIRIRAGRPAAGKELTGDYIPLEAGLWDEISFSKGCYTGQEIIARMESRNRLARTLVRLHFTEMIDAPTELTHEGRAAGLLTSSVTAPDGERFGLGFVRLSLAIPGTVLHTTAGQSVTVIELAGAQPPFAESQ